MGKTHTCSLFPLFDIPLEEWASLFCTSTVFHFSCLYYINNTVKAFTLYFVRCYQKKPRDELKYTGRCVQIYANKLSHIYIYI